jgi:hypothetical protein
VDGKSPVMSCYSKPIIVDKEPLIDTCMLWVWHWYPLEIRLVICDLL